MHSVREGRQAYHRIEVYGIKEAFSCVFQAGCLVTLRGAGVDVLPRHEFRQESGCDSLIPVVGCPFRKLLCQPVRFTGNGSQLQAIRARMLVNLLKTLAVSAGKHEQRGYERSDNVDHLSHGVI